MFTYEKALYEQGYQLIAGLDEAGRGPLAGPVVAASVILPQNLIIPDINDSKKLSPSCRNRLFDEIQKNAISYGIGVVPEDAIDRINILRASLEAMEIAVQSMSTKPDFLLIDGLYILTHINLPMKAIVKGDSLSQSIAAASIIAKVTRDRIMCEMDKAYPQYGFTRHKGYPTAEHLEAINKYGPCKIHRKTFAPVANTSFSSK